MENITLPEWYMSTNGPKVSQTIFNLVGGFLPVINIYLSAKGVNFLPESVNASISIIVFACFSIRAAFGYIKAKRNLQQQIGSLRNRLGATVGTTTLSAYDKYVWYGPHPCQKCDADVKKGTKIVKAGNGAPDDLEFDFVHDSQYPGHKWSKHICK